MHDEFRDQITKIEYGKFWAQVIALAPFAFQAARSLRDLGILKLISESKVGMSSAEISKKLDLNLYSVDVLLDAGESAFLVSKKEDLYFLTVPGRYILEDKLTNVNMNFTQDVCYQGIFNLEESLATGAPKGLSVFGQWKTIYQGLTSLPQKVLKSWLDFDHFYSDDAFPKVLPIIFKNKPKKILDVGGNTGKFAFACCAYDPNVEVTILDHPNQLDLALAEAARLGFKNRIRGQAIDLLDHTQAFPKGYDVIWMSQFLDCFSVFDIEALMARVRAALDDSGYYYILEPFSDKQRYLSAKFSVDMVSLYFTALANGCSRFYPAKTFRELLIKNNFSVESEIDLRLSHTLMICRGLKKSA